VPCSRSKRHLHFASIRLYLALLFIISVFEFLKTDKELSLDLSRVKTYIFVLHFKSNSRSWRTILTNILNSWQ
jgi:hypothetical protein